MAAHFKNSPLTTQKLPLVNLDGTDYPVSEIVRIANEAGKISVTAQFEEVLPNFEPPVPAEHVTT